MRYHIAQKDNDHVVACERQCVLTGAEEHQYRVEENQCYDGEQASNYDIEHHFVKKDFVCDGIILLPQQH